MAEHHRYGRDEDRAAAFARAGGFMLVVGDSGIGKSDFLASLRAWPGDPLVAKPRTLRSLNGSLQTALADAISDCTVQFLGAQRDLDTGWAIVKSVADRASDVSGREIRQLVFGRVLEWAESRLGKDVVAYGRKFLGDALKGGVLGFDERLAGLRVPDRAEQLGTLLADVAALTARRLVILIDNAERLTPDDRGLLTELATSVYGDVHVIATVARHHTAGDEVIRQAAERNVEPLVLQPLRKASLEEWYSAAGVPVAQWDSITRLSSGYPLFVADAIRIANDGVQLHALETPHSFSTLMQTAWNQLATSLKEVASQLSPFIDPPSQDFLKELLGFDPLRWQLVRDELEHAGVFVRRSDGDVWFHDRRRAFIWDTVLSDASRWQVASTALDRVVDRLENEGQIESWMPAAVAVLNAATRRPALERPRDVVALPSEAIALLWALLEIPSEKALGQDAAEVGELVRHAELRSGLQIDALTLLEQLSEQGFLETFEDDGFSHARLLEHPEILRATLLGEVYRRFHTAVHPHLAFATFKETVRPLLEPFGVSFVSTRTMTFPDHALTLAAIHGNARWGHRAGEAHALGATLLVDDLPVSFTATFRAASELNTALERLSSLKRMTGRLRLARVHEFPRRRLPHQIYRAALERLDVDLRDHPVCDARGILDVLDTRTKYTAVLADESSPEEREVLRLRRARFLVAKYPTPGGHHVIEVATDHPAPTVQIPVELMRRGDGLRELRLRADGRIHGQERILTSTYSYTSEGDVRHPIIGALDAIERRGREYNNGWARVLIPVDVKLLEREITAAQLRIDRIANGLASAGLASEVKRRRTLLVGIYENPAPTIANSFGNWEVVLLEVEDEVPRVIVKLLPEPVHVSWSDDVVPSAFESHTGAPLYASAEGDANSIIGRLLGFAFEDTEFMDTETELGRLASRTRNVLGADDIA